MNSISTKGKWSIAPQMALFYTVAFFGAIALAVTYFS